MSTAIPTVIRIHYNPPEGATLGVRCGGQGNEWSKFYFATKKGEAWECTVPMVRPSGGEAIEFKPVLQYNSPSSPSLSSSPSSSSSHSPSSPSSSSTSTSSLAPSKLAATSPSLANKFAFSSPDLRTHFLKSSSSAFLKSSSSYLKPSSSSSSSSPSPSSSSLKSSSSSVSSTSGSPSLAKGVMSSPLRPSAYSVEGERDETYAIGANYIVQVGRSIDVYPWFYTYHGNVDTIEDILKDTRNIIVYTPPSYHENTLKKYPVLLMQDAHNLFYEHLSFCGRIWKIPFTMNELCISGVIQVAVTPIKREYEYLPPTPGGRSDGGGAEFYLDFISKELKPLIAEKYRITGEYGIAGSSYGGIISLYAWLTRPEEYTKCGCYSPSLKWHKGHMLSLAADVCENLSTTHSKHLMYLDAGTEFDQALATSKLAKKLEKAFTPDADIQSQGDYENKPRALVILEKVLAVTGTDDTYEEGIRYVPPADSYGAVLKSGKVMLNVGQGHNHSEDSWAKRTPLALSFLLKDDQRETKWVKDVVDDISARVLY